MLVAPVVWKLNLLPIFLYTLIMVPHRYLTIKYQSDNKIVELLLYSSK